MIFVAIILLALLFLCICGALGFILVCMAIDAIIKWFEGGEDE